MTNAQNYKETGCLKTCDYYEYSVEVSFKPEREREINGTMFVGFYTNDPKVPVYRQVFNYRGADFVADIGGYLGLLLGASCWSLFKLITMDMSWGVPTLFKSQNGEKEPLKKSHSYPSGWFQ